MRRNVIRILIVLAFTLLSVSLLASLISPDALLASAVRNAENYVFKPLSSLFSHRVFVWEFAAVIAVCIALQFFVPAKPKERTFSKYFAQDAVWFVYHELMAFFVLSTYVFYLKLVYTEHFSFLTIESIASAPAWFRFVFGILLYDFLFWLQHYLNHKVPLFWTFHSLHHSQTELNFFSDFRYHGVEYIVRHTVLTLPLLVLAFDVPTIIIYAFIVRWSSRFYHCNIRTNLGPLRYLFVTPQSHRLHHAKNREYRDMNYGSIFSIWDFAFGTQVKVYDEYPETGIDDADFPVETSSNPFKLLVMPVVQMVYCFTKAGRQIAQSFSARPSPR